MKWEYIGTGLGLIGIGITLMLALPPPWFPKMPQSFIYAGILGGIFSVVIGCALSSIGVFPVLEHRIGPIFLMVAGVFLFSSGVYWYHIQGKPLISQQNFSLHDLFLDDFGDGGYKFIQYLSSDFTRNGESIGNHAYEVGMYGNFNAKSVFISVFVPGDPHAYDIIAWFADGYKVYLEDARKNFHIFPEPQGDQSQPLSDELLFTKKIYIYHENILTDQQIYELSDTYRKKGLDPTFRGFGYLEYRRQQAITNPNSAPKNYVQQAKKIQMPHMLPPIDMSPQLPPKKIDGAP